VKALVNFSVMRSLVPAICIASGLSKPGTRGQSANDAVKRASFRFVKLAGPAGGVRIMVRHEVRFTPL